MPDDRRKFGRARQEMESLSEEVSALKCQLQETLARQRVSADDLQNVLYSTDVATLFLDAGLRIRFFTPATTASFEIVEADVGRPLSELPSLAADAALAGDARRVLDTHAPIEREVATPTGIWSRRVLPYRMHDDAVGGVVITFADITARKRSAKALEAAKVRAEQANAATSRFLVASHDLRQPLQSLSLLQGLLAEQVEGGVSEQLVARLADTVGAMSSMLNTLLDVVPTDAGPVALPPPRARRADAQAVFLVDDDRNVREAVRLLLERDGWTVHDYPSGEAFFASYVPGAAGCLLVDAYLPGISGLALLQRLRAAGDRLPAIVITGSSDVSMAVEAMKAGAADLIEKPIAGADLLLSIDRALDRARDASKQVAWHANAAEHVAGLTLRQHQIMGLVLAGQSSKIIAADLGISQRTVENHRACIMRKTGAKSLPALARLALAATTDDAAAASP